MYSGLVYWEAEGERRISGKCASSGIGGHNEPTFRGPSKRSGCARVGSVAVHEGWSILRKSCTQIDTAQCTEGTEGACRHRPFELHFHFSQLSLFLTF